MPKTSLLIVWLVLLSGLRLLHGQGSSPFAELNQLIKPRSTVIDPEGLSMEELRVQRSMVALSGAAKPGYYRNERLYRQIFTVEDTGARSHGDLNQYLHLLDSLLSGYVGRFQVDNFTRDYRFLWLLGRVKERKGDTALAVMYYQLADLHNHDSVPRLHLDSLLAPARSDWVSIEEYYKLLEIRARVDTMRPPKVRTNMGDYINSPSADYAPHVHRSDKILIFTSRRDTTGMVGAIGPDMKQNEDLYYSEYDVLSGGPDEGGNWLPATRFDESINTKFNEGSCCLSPDGTKLFFTRCGSYSVDEPDVFRVKTGRYDTTITLKREDKLEGFGNCDLYVAEFDTVTGRFSNVKNLGAAINSEAWDSQPNLSVDGRSLYFASNRNGGYGGTDLYVSHFDTVDLVWRNAQNLGPLINTAENESTPYYNDKYATLYFSSMGQLFNYGSYDIFKSRFLGDRWELPNNVGPLINDEGSQEYFAISGDGKYMYYSSANDVDQSRVSQNFDLYSFPMPGDARADANALLKGVLRDSVSGYPLVGKVLIIDLEEGVEYTPKEINDSGYFEFNLIDERRYKLIVVGEDYLTINRKFRMKGDTSFSIITRSFNRSDSTDGGKPFVFAFESLEFKSNSSKLSAKLKPSLDYLARFLQTYPQFKLIIEGHTDADGADDRNMKLSLDRAQRLRDYLIRKGSLDPGRLSAKGYGETRPLVPNDTEENKARNRRVEFKLVVDETYDGEMFWPSDDEFYFKLDSGFEVDPEFDGEFEWTPDDKIKWDEELDKEPAPIDPLDAGKELDKAILEDIEDKLDDEKKKKAKKDKKKDEDD